MAYRMSANIVMPIPQPIISWPQEDCDEIGEAKKIEPEIIRSAATAKAPLAVIVNEMSFAILIIRDMITPLLKVIIFPSSS